MSFTSRMQGGPRGSTNVIIENNGIPVLVIPLDDFLRLKVVRYAVELDRELMQCEGPAAA